MAALNASKFGPTFYNIWNLEFFNFLIPNSCLYEGFSPLNAIAIWYISAFYPLVLIGLAYTCIELHGRNCKLIVWLWKPFHKCEVKFDRIWDLQQSVVHAFATFLILSYTKVADISYSPPNCTMHQGNKWGQEYGIMMHQYSCFMLNIFRMPSYPLPSYQRT